MWLVLLIAVLSACSKGSPAPVVPAGPLQPAAETLWDSGTFIVVDKEVILPDTEENFEIYRREGGYRITVKFKRPAPTGERSEGEGTLLVDDRFSPQQGTMTTTLHFTDHQEVMRSKLQREPDGRLSTEVTNADGSKEAAHSNAPNDWFVGGSVTSFLIPLCQADASITAPTVYPDKATALAPFKALPIEGSDRNVQSRVLTYDLSHRQIIAACENGKLAGEVARGTTIVRKGDLVLARVLERWYR
jgi:hypothetical protein